MRAQVHPREDGLYDIVIKRTKHGEGVERAAIGVARDAIKATVQRLTTEMRAEMRNAEVLNRAYGG